MLFRLGDKVEQLLRRHFDRPLGQSGCGLWSKQLACSLDRCAPASPTWKRVQQRLSYKPCGTEFYDPKARSPSPSPSASSAASACRFSSLISANPTNHFSQPAGYGLDLGSRKFLCLLKRRLLLPRRAQSPRTQGRQWYIILYSYI